MAASVITRLRQEADVRRDGPAGQSQLGATPGGTRCHRDRTFANVSCPRITYRAAGACLLASCWRGGRCRRSRASGQNLALGLSLQASLAGLLRVCRFRLSVDGQLFADPTHLADNRFSGDALKEALEAAATYGQ